MGRISALCAAARCRGQLQAAKGHLTTAVDEFHVALEWHGKLTQRFERARTLLSLGVAERRMKQWAAARAALQESLNIFESIGGTLWRIELGPSWDDLVPPVETED